MNSMTPRPYPAAVLVLLALSLAPPSRAADGPATSSAPPAPHPAAAVRVSETDDAVTIETDALSATIRKKGYVSGIAAGSFVDKKTGAKDVGFGLHIQDFLLAPGWRDDGYQR